MGAEQHLARSLTRGPGREPAVELGELRSPDGSGCALLLELGRDPKLLGARSLGGGGAGRELLRGSRSLLRGGPPVPESREGCEWLGAP